MKNQNKKQEKGKFAPSKINPNLKQYFKDLATKWPSSFIAREKVGVFTGGIISPGTMANIDCIGAGPESFKIGRKVCYPVVPFIEWMKARVN